VILEAQMSSTFVAPEQSPPTPLIHTRPVPTDADALLPELQVTLTALTDLEIRHEIELDCLEEWSGRGSVKRSLYAEREGTYQQARAAHLERLAGLRERIMGHH
jgi:hypothetical protein